MRKYVLPYLCITTYVRKSVDFMPQSSWLICQLYTDITMNCITTKNIKINCAFWTVSLRPFLWVCLNIHQCVALCTVQAIAFMSIAMQKLHGHSHCFQYDIHVGVDVCSQTHTVAFEVVNLYPHRSCIGSISGHCCVPVEINRMACMEIQGTLCIPVWVNNVHINMPCVNKVLVYEKCA